MKVPIEMMLDGCEWRATDGSTEDAEAEYKRTGIPYATHEGHIDIPAIGQIDCVQLNNGQRLIVRTPGSLLDQLLTGLGVEEGEVRS